MKFWEHLYSEYHYEQLDHIRYDKWGYEITLDIGLMKDQSTYARYEVKFSGCNDIQISIHDPSSPEDLDESPEIIDFQLGEADYVLPAVIYTDSMTLSIKYKAVSATRTL